MHFLNVFSMKYGISEHFPYFVENPSIRIPIPPQKSILRKDTQERL